MDDVFSNIDAFRRFGLEWDEGDREISVRHSEEHIRSDIPPDVLTSLTLRDIARLVKKGWLEDGDLVTVWEIEREDADGTTYFRNPPSTLPLSEVRARIRLLRR